MEPEQALSVSQLNGYIKEILEGTFPDVWIEAEFSDVSQPRSGHVYFTLKDERSQIRGVMWRGTATRVAAEMGGKLPREGDRVLCQGGVDVYPPRGSYQINVRRMQAVGLGALQQRFEALQRRLQAEGLFAAERKRPVPPMPRRIAVVTSPTSAAIRDFLQAALSRWAGIQIVVVPAMVQGERAAKSLADAIASVPRIVPAVDALVVTRGGGSLEDLWCFNEEIVVRAIATVTIPVISGVGHEIDVTLADLVADVRALTPTDAASHAVPDRSRISAGLEDLTHRLNVAMRGRLEEAGRRLESLADRPVLSRPHAMVLDRARQGDDLEQDLTRSMRETLRRRKAELEKSAASLEALSPLRTLARGYSVTLDQSGTAVTSTVQVAPGDEIRTRLADGEIRSVVADC